MSVNVGIGEGTLVPRTLSPPAYIEKDVGSPSLAYEWNRSDHFREEDFGDEDALDELELDTPQLPAEKEDGLENSEEELTPMLALPPTADSRSPELAYPRLLRPLMSSCTILMDSAGLTRAGVIRLGKSIVLASKVNSSILSCSAWNLTVPDLKDITAFLSLS